MWIPIKPSWENDECVEDHHCSHHSTLGNRHGNTNIQICCFFIFFYWFFFLWKHFHLNPLVHQSNPLEHGASASDQSDSFQPEASFSFTAGRKQLDTRKSQGRWKSQRQLTHEGPKDKIEQTYSQSSRVGYYYCDKIKTNSKNDMCKLTLGL